MVATSAQVPFLESADFYYFDYAAVSRAVTENLEPLAQRARDAGVPCEIVVRPGLAADQILAFLRERPICRIVMGTHSPGPIGKLLLGSVAEAVLRSASVPVFIVGPEVVTGSFRDFAIRTILCAVSLMDVRHVVVDFAVRLAEEYRARLILQHVIRPQERQAELAGRTIDQIEAELLLLAQREAHISIAVQAIVVTGDPTEELLYQARAQQADLIVTGAQGASAFAAITRHGVVYKVVAHSQCPVITLSPIVLAECGAKFEKMRQAEAYLAGVF